MGLETPEWVLAERMDFWGCGEVGRSRSIAVAGREAEMVDFRFFAIVGVEGRYRMRVWQ